MTGKMRFRQYRMLIVAYGVALLVGAREYVVSRSGDTTDWVGGCRASAAACSSVTSRAGLTDDSTFWRQHRAMTEVVARVNPDDPDTDFLVGMQALADGDSEESVRRLEAALAAGVRHNDYLQQYYAQYELNRGADWQRVNFAVNRWRRNHPSSPEPIYLRLGAGPRDEAEAALLRGALAEVPWIADSRLESSMQDGEEQWRVQLIFRPGRTVDMRQAVEAVSLLSLTEDQRAQYRVRCGTLQECRLEPRS